MTEATSVNNPPSRPPSRRRGKSETAFRTISEVATDLDLPQHVLRFWETRFVQIAPMKRGGGRRYYRPEDVALLRRIRGLLYDDGYTIKGVQKLFKQNGGQVPEPNAVAAVQDAEGGEVAAATAAGLSPHQRGELNALLGELEDLRDFLRGSDK
ncbi:MAG: MerR family transcriptional regulator [Rhodospirillales bacterium]|jgi:DNA-binding transcriptional MerR regulator|nr:MerR family transcriptional regulator [Rhodospirillales bacterium]